MAMGLWFCGSFFVRIGKIYTPKRKKWVVID